MAATYSKYKRIKSEILSCIQSGMFGENECLPSEREFCERYNVSRITVRKAIAEMEQEGLLYRIHGKGTFVKQKEKITQGLTRLTGFTEDMQSRGMVPGTKILLLEQSLANSEVAEKLKLKVGDPIILLRRLRLADGEPMAIETTYLDHKLFFKMPEEFSGGSLYNYMREKLGIVQSRAIQSIEVAFLQDWESDLLGQGDINVALLMHRLTFDTKDRPIEYVVSKYRSDKYKFHIEMRNI